MVKVRVAFVFVAMAAFLLLVLEGVQGDGICNMSVEGLESCKPAIQNGDSVEDPSGDCCTALQSADYKCLCKYKDSYVLKTMDINSTRAMALPQTCKIATAPIKCGKPARHD